MNILGHILQNDGGIRSDWKFTRKMLWGSFWKNCGSTRLQKADPTSKTMLLQRTVVAGLVWKLSRWPFQQLIAVELDRVQCQMMAMILPCTRMPEEDIGVYCRRKLRLARNFCESAGFWSLLWCDRVDKWNQHIHRGDAYGHMCAI